LRIKARYFTTLRELAESPEEGLEMERGSTFDLIEKTAMKYGKKGSIPP